MCQMSMKHKWILCLDLGSIPKIFRYIYVNIPKCERNPKSETLLCFMGACMTMDTQPEFIFIAWNSRMPCLGRCEKSGNEVPGWPRKSHSHSHTCCHSFLPPPRRAGWLLWVPLQSPVGQRPPLRSVWGTCQPCQSRWHTCKQHVQCTHGSPVQPDHHPVAADLCSYHVSRRGVLIHQQPCLLESRLSPGWAWHRTASKEQFSPK
jgi:hypothetical protein